MTGKDDIAGIPVTRFVFFVSHPPLPPPPPASMPPLEFDLTKTTNKKSAEFAKYKKKLYFDLLETELTRLCPQNIFKSSIKTA